VKTIIALIAGTVLLAAPRLSAQLLPGNFWPNPDFEIGDNLDLPEGTLNNWSRGGANPGICQVSPIASSPSHALAVVDTDNQYGEWYCDVSLGGRAEAGDALDLRWSEVYDIIGSEMRVTLVFFGSGGGMVGAKHFVVRGQSEGFTGDLATSPFVLRNESIDVPEGAATLRISLVSGGSLETTGTLIIDALSVARHPTPQLLPGNLWTNNPTFEEGENLDQPTGTLTHWNRGGATPAICQILHSASLSPTHALAVVDTDNGYGEWYSDLPLAGVAQAGDTLNLQWFELFDVAGGEMRVTVLFLAAGGGVLDARHFLARNQSAGWAGIVAASPFVKRAETVTVPEGAATFRVSLVSGGAAETTGVFVLDDFSMNKATPPLPVVLAGNVWPNPGFEEGENLDDPANATMANWSRGGGDPSICVVSPALAVSPTHALALEDNNADGYGEWYADFRLGAATAGGRLLNLQWFELYDISGGEMRLTLVFFDANNQVLGQNHFVRQGASDGWKGNIAASSFTRRNEQVAVPTDARRLQVALVSGGALTTQGVMLVDNLSLAPETTPPVALFGNFWPNVGFEEGTALDNPNTGIPQGWGRGGADPTIDQVLTAAYQSSTHALAVVDTMADSYGEWYQFLDLAGKATPGDTVQVQWWEMFNVSDGGEMRLSLVFRNAADATVGEQHYLARGQSSGWIDDPAHSFFTPRNEQLVVPANATRLLVTLTSGGPAETTGTMLIDDLSVAKPPPPPEILARNFWPNPTFENGTQLDKPSLGLPDGWNRGGTHIPGDQVTTTRATSPTHALAVVDPKTDAYSEWYANLILDGKANVGDTLDLQWHELYDTTGDMRVSFYFFTADNAVAGQRHFVVSGQSEGWSGDLATSPFKLRREELVVPEGAVRLMVTLASGGSLAVTGTMIVDDFSIRVATLDFRITDLQPNQGGWRLTWESTPGAVYSVETSPTLTPPAFVTVPGLDGVIASDAATTSATDPRVNPSAQFYRVVRVQ
jgi:hypothetical protein